jgi:hypothetical protein
VNEARRPVEELGRGRGVAAPALLHALIHRSAWGVGPWPIGARLCGITSLSLNFAFWGFSEVAPGFVTPHTYLR